MMDAQGLNIHSVLISQGDRIVAERYRRGRDRGLYSLWSSNRDFGPDDLHDMRSVSKSVIALLYGILLERGEVPALDTPVSALYPDHPDLAQPPKNAILIRHLLTMTAGLAWDEPSPVHRPLHDDQTALVWSRDLYAEVFGRDVQAPPGERFFYSGGLTSVLVDCIERSTGRALTELLNEHLFQPLDIREWSWTKDLRGRPLAFAGLRLRPRDLLKIGRLVLAGGQWRGRQLVPAAWVAAATQAHVQASADLGYGYQWWTRTITLKGRPFAVTMAIGNGGQRLYVLRDLDLVVAMTAGDYGTLEILLQEDRLFAQLLAAAARSEAQAAR